MATHNTKGDAFMFLDLGNLVAEFQVEEYRNSTEQTCSKDAMLISLFLNSQNSTKLYF